MTDQEYTRRLEKFRQRAKMVGTVEHFQKIMATFPEEKHPDVMANVESRLAPSLRLKLAKTP